MYFTSGSSGPPKAVIHAARGVYVRSYQPWAQLGVGEIAGDDRVLVRAGVAGDGAGAEPPPGGAIVDARA